MKARSIKGKNAGEIQAALEQNMADGFLPTLAIAFVSVQINRTEIRKIFNDTGIVLFGATTNGEFIDETIGTGTAAILLLDIKKDHFKLYFEEYPEGNYREVAMDIARKAVAKFQTPAFIISLSHQATDGEAILHGFEEVVGPAVNVFGGCAGDDYTFSEQFVFTNDQDSGHAMVCIVLDEEKVTVKGIATCGWKAIGTEKTVTKSEGNHVYTVDNIPVLDITAKYGGIQNVTPDNKALLLEIAANLPLQLLREKGDPIMRPGLKIDWNDH
ncbi:MAG TPA: FIST N-terminal domain-containing protein, partial [Ferruginibacter sp.]|nr:FIST N-terminal domain-containing protein [Ferruginibacter sp.]